MKKKVLILGAGLSGVYLGYKLKQAGFEVQILEARNRVGGRILTNHKSHTKVELGAAWLWKYNEELLKLCRALEISLFPQNMEGDALFEASHNSRIERFRVPKNQEISYRISGGTAHLLKKLTMSFSPEELLLSQKVAQIATCGAFVKVFTEKLTFVGDFVISTIPPQLLVNTVALPSEISQKLLKIANNTHTWMQDSIKFGVVYKTPFWEEKNLSGAGFSSEGAFTEIYDHTDAQKKRFALMGFVNQTLVNATSTHREKEVRKQLFRFFGKDGEDYIAYQEKAWPEDALVHFKNTITLKPHANNGHPIYQEEFLEGKLFFGGSETSKKYGGYMEGAICRGNEIVDHLKNTSK
ncbi:amine oxidase family, flavin-containing protein [Polaribacter irgensii 23-P]|uniref:Amine oxidase family, flavin-containing protein n=1 Tax=Polaribacter irgensii 23-P TaxID=313594 RepID=A4BYU7_9FLAO|nr:FAD-dependent oxidoreductase [Polaribacter irgensii]EAR12340.1 amine oxidase family, flavin-containing protein [Polaribacter irgensii 23-P]